MIVFHSFLQEGKELVPIERATKPPPDDFYIEGVVEMLVDGRPILRRDSVDLVDQLWAYLVRGLEQLERGEDFSTSYPDMWLQVRMQRQATRVLITVDNPGEPATAVVELAELRRAMVPAAEAFFQRLAQLSPASQASCQRHLTRLAQLR